MSTFTRTTATEWVCVDCHLAIAGYGSDDTGRDMPTPFADITGVEDVTNGTSVESCEYIEDHKEGAEVYVGSSTMDEWTAIYELHTECDHDSFSLHPCAGCGSALAGDRYAVTVSYIEWADES